MNKIDKRKKAVTIFITIFSICLALFVIIKKIIADDKGFKELEKKELEKYEKYRLKRNNA